MNRKSLVLPVGLAAATLAAALALTLAVALPAPAHATCSEFLCYTSPTAMLCCEANGPFDGANRAVFLLANDRLPVVLGLERAAARQGKRFTVRDGWARQEITVNGASVAVTGRRTWSELVEILAHTLDCAPEVRTHVPAFSIQLELLPAGVDPEEPLKVWRYYQPTEEIERGLLSHSGDCSVQPYWTHTYPDGRTAIRYGVFTSVSSARAAIETTAFGPVHPQIVRTTLRADSVNTYFGIRLTPGD